MPVPLTKIAKTMRPPLPRTGVFVVSLDFELHWGVRDRVTARSSYQRNLLGAREAIPRILSLFREYEIAATWATVGLLFAESKSEVAAYLPAIKPTYENSRLDPYRERCGENELEDPLHYAPTLIALIQNTPRQEIGCHTFSHYYCLEPGQSQEAFTADAQSAVLLARRRGISLKSIVFPRNQVNSEYLSGLPKLGFTSYRGAESGWAFIPDPSRSKTVVRRAARLADQYMSVYRNKLCTWEELEASDGLCNVRGSMFLRPFLSCAKGLDSIRLHRIGSCIREAAVTGRVFHLWWHPHNFGVCTEENLQFLRSVLDVVAECRTAHGLRCLAMSEVAAEANARRLQLEADSVAAERVLV